ncbi:MAG: hypothetical protein U1E45_23175 [Geminicoccaceae bacterium]
MAKVGTELVSTCPRLDPQRAGLPPAQWPAADRTAWAAAQIAGGPLDEVGAASHWAPATRRKVAGSYGRYLGWLQRSGQLDAAGAVCAGLTEPVVAAYLRDPALAASTMTRLCRVADLRLFATAVLPTGRWDWLRRMEAAARQRVTPDSERRMRLQPAGELVQLGERLMADAKLRQPIRGRALTLYRDGLMIALLAMAPLRLKNFTALELGRTLIRRGSLWWITIPGGETKTGRPYERPFPERLLAPLSYYLDQVRPILLDSRSRWTRPAGMALWISTHGSSMVPATIYQQIVLRTGQAFGTPLHPHLFRHCVSIGAGTGPRIGLQ